MREEDKPLESDKFLEELQILFKHRIEDLEEQIDAIIQSKQRVRIDNSSSLDLQNTLREFKAIILELEVLRQELGL